MALEGTLEDMPFADLFDVFRAGRRSGRLLVSREEERGLIFVGSGQLVDAVLVSNLEGENTVYAEDAVIRILSWSEATFVFEHDPTVNQRPRRIERDSAWFFTALAQVPRPAITLRSRLRPLMPDHDATGPFTLSVDEWRLLSALWEQPSLSMACVELELDSHQVLPLAQSLIDRGLLTIAEEKDQQRVFHRGAERAHPALKITTLRHPTHPYPAATPKSQLLQAIMRRVRAL